MIDRDHELPITRQAELLDMSRSSVYYLPRPVSAADLALMRRIDELHLEHPFMGARMLRDQLQREGIKVGRRHITTLMLRMGIQALAPQPGTSKRALGHKIYPYLLRTLSITRCNRVWALDTTYIPMARGFVYLPGWPPQIPPPVAGSNSSRPGPGDSRLFFFDGCSASEARHAAGERSGGGGQAADPAGAVHRPVLWAGGLSTAGENQSAGALIARRCAASLSR